MKLQPVFYCLHEKNDSYHTNLICSRRMLFQRQNPVHSDLSGSSAIDLNGIRVRSKTPE